MDPQGAVAALSHRVTLSVSWPQLRFMVLLTAQHPEGRRGLEGRKQVEGGASKIHRSDDHQTLHELLGSPFLLF